MVKTPPEAYLSQGLTHEEFEEICRLLGREPTPTELGMFSVQWSEHCSYKRSKPALAYFAEYRRAVEGKGLENAGVAPIGDGLGVVMKIESHNHPSAVEPYQGAATGVGGIIRDVLSMGARPVALLNSLRFGPIRDGEADGETVRRNRYLFERVVAGIAGYGNCVGVPTVAGEVGFHPRYSGNPLVNAMCVGVVRLDEVATAAAAGPGNPVLYLGSATGRDGIHGASFASETLDEESGSKRPNVQIGDPFAGKLLIEATLEALATGAVQSIQDMGAAGLTCSTTEMSARGSVGMKIDLDLVPAREPGMSAYELMLSESQERMLCVAHRGREREVIEVFRKWGLEARVIGEVTEGTRVVVSRSGRKEVDVEAKAMTDGCPTQRPAAEEPEYYRRAGRFSIEGLAHPDPNEALLALLGSPDLASKRWVYEQFDQQVQTQTVLVAGVGDAAVIAPRGTKKGLALKIDGNARYVHFDPYVGGLLAVCEAARNVACVGARPLALTDGLNYGDPTRPHVYWQFERSVRGLADAAEALGLPVVSGNVSFFNESEMGEVLPTPMVGMLGLLEEAERRIGFGPGPGLELGLLECAPEPGPQRGLGAGSYLAEVLGIEDGRPEAPDLAGEKALAETLAALVSEGLLAAAHDSSEGGLAVCLAEMAIAGGVGIRAEAPARGGAAPDLFGEFPGVVAVAYRAEDGPKIRGLLNSGVSFRRVGSTDGSDSFRVVASDGTGISLSASKLAEVWARAVPSAMSDGSP
jgi:phosphoribosylformylglycinamidine synthase